MSKCTGGINIPGNKERALPGVLPRPGQAEEPAVGSRLPAGPFGQVWDSPKWTQQHALLWLAFTGNTALSIHPPHHWNHSPVWTCYPPPADTGAVSSLGCREQSRSDHSPTSCVYVCVCVCVCVKHQCSFPHVKTWEWSHWVRGQIYV